MANTKKVKFKKIVAFATIMVICFLTLLMTAFVNTDILITEAYSANRHIKYLGRGYQIEYSLDASSGERIDIRVNRTICIAEDFCDRTIIVTLRESFSFPNNTLNIHDFALPQMFVSERATLSLTNIFGAVEDLTYFTNCSSIMALSTKSFSESNKQQSFNQILSLELNEPGKQNVLNAIALLEQLDKVLAAEPSFYDSEVTTHSELHSFESFSLGEQWWGLDRLRAAEVWGITRGQGVRVGIMDSGVFAHTSFGTRLLPGNSPTPTDLHGTHVAGTVAGVSSGIAPNAYIVPLNWNSSQFINTMTFARNNGVRVVNASFFWGNAENPQFSPTTAQVNAVRNFGGVLVGTAGNRNVHFSERREYPAAFGTSFGLNNVIVVGASNTNERRSHYGDGTGWAAGRGSVWSSVDVCIFAPGENIRSTVASNGYINWTGTSMAAPHVAGTAALMLAVNPSLAYSPYLVRQLLIDTAYIPNINGVNPLVRYGRESQYY